MELLSRSGKSFLGIPKPDDLCNPYTSDPAGNPPTFSLRRCAGLPAQRHGGLGHKLHDAGVPTRLVMYNGMGHGFLNAMGVFPQPRTCWTKWALLSRMFVKAINSR